MLLVLLFFVFVALLFALIQLIFIVKKEKGAKDIQKISKNIEKGALTFLSREYQVIAIFLLVISILIGIFNVRFMISFLLGSFFSLSAGNLGMRIATKNNARTTNAASKSLEEAFKIAYFSGLVASIFAVSFGILGIILVGFLFEIKALYFFAFGASLVALFMRVGGGIFTKSADIGADLTGKIEAKIPEDDPRNPAVIADLVGDNVGDITGMGSDLFESFVSSIVAAIAIAVSFFKSIYTPLIIPSLGLVVSIPISYFFMKIKDVHKKLLSIFISTAILLSLFSFFLFEKNLAWCVVLGLLAGIFIGWNTNYFTAFNLPPTKKIVEASKKGTALNIIYGIANGMLSAIFPVVVIALIILLSFWLAGLYGIAISAVGMLSLVTVVFASDVYGSITDNAAGISEFCRLKEARKRAELLDEAGNTTAAIGKGFAIGSAALTSLALLATYLMAAKKPFLNIADAGNIAGLFIGVVIPFLFSSLALKAVVSGAEKIVENVRKQFKNAKILQGKLEPDYEECIKITTSSALSSLVLPGIVVIVMPFIIGFLLGKEALGSFLVGSIASSFLLAFFMANAGASFDNAKKYVEIFEKKKEKFYEAVIVGDTVGDPLKDTAGPSLNILIKLMCIISLLFVILF
ncbi:MAG: sodium-translocating pyrophosphatase [Candidatus Pacearchaeota archaeon]|nr:sodium-translocating pyrophosphatase [Candidatus Pacearchaeota archaeon]